MARAFFEQLPAGAAERLATDGETAVNRCEDARDRLQCLRIVKIEYAEAYPTQMVRTGAFQLAGVMLVSLSMATWLTRVTRR